MAEARFAAFSFVDRITRSDGDGRVEGRYTVPAGVDRFPASLMAEAVGQLAAWSAMSRLDFALRPVAGLAAETRYHALVRPGQTLTLEADVERCDADAVAYGGRALVDGRLAVELVGCVGPMLPMADFDDPAAVRADFATLCGAGAAPGRFAGVPPPRLDALGAEAGRGRRALLQVPARDAAPFFGDHFPRRPVYPGTLLMDALATLALGVAREALADTAALAPRRVGDVKIRAFTAPGSTLELAADLIEAGAGRAHCKATARADGRAVATARIEVAAMEAA